MSKQVDWTDDDGRKFKMSVPDDAEESEWAYGNPIGPPSLASLGLPLREEVRLNNFLHAMGIFNARQAHYNRAHIQAAWQRTLAVGTEAIVDVYGLVEEEPVIMRGPEMERPVNTPQQPVTRRRRR